LHLVPEFAAPLPPSAVKGSRTKSISVLLREAVVVHSHN
jgi:hypothetical protein